MHHQAAAYMAGLLNSLSLEDLKMPTHQHAAWLQLGLLWLGAILIAFFMTGNAHADDPLAGDAPANPGPLARLSGSMQPRDIRLATEKVAAWQFARIKTHYSTDWTFAPLYAGLVDTATWLGHSNYRNYVKEAGAHFHWSLGPRLYNADDQSVAQAWLALYRWSHDPSMLAPTRTRYDAQLRQAPNPHKPVWWWSDALFMAPPSWAGLSAATDDPAYLDYMNHQWWTTTDLLYDTREHLYSRDVTYLNRRERNGQKLFWCRGNGWVMAGLVRVLAHMPDTYAARPRYVRLLQQMSSEMVKIQGTDGLWRPGLLDPSAYPLPDVSGSALITYALAWGVHHHLLDAATYRPVIAKAWAGMVSKIYTSGRLGDIQPIAAAPDHYRASSSYTYGVGAFLLAARQVDAVAEMRPRR